MKLVCLDLEGVLVPEIWIAFAEATGISALRRTTRDEPDYNKLMAYRLAILDEHRLKLSDIQRIISGMEPLEGALSFCNALRERCQFVILSDTFEQFAKPLMQKLVYPVLFCNTLEVDSSGRICAWHLRQTDGKRRMVEAFASCNIEVFAAGDSFNDLSMIHAAKAGCLFRAPKQICAANAEIPQTESYAGLLEQIDTFLNGV
ncbi:MAG: bifunctional phosphoserine phosphatase/homoserine phosphotransferase ThrH [Termitinemataceae bacterium]|jgi:phosphoserine/homoserine phosphotransferase|nr:MAG: bifunctional phosphoserine phosphatase/homoserine phosphotransferase ThrH [Termitinemataceae bacterium]